MLGMEETEDDGDLEAELLALTGEAGATGRKPAPKGQGEFVALGGLVAGIRWVQVGGRDGCLLTAGRSQLDHQILDTLSSAVLPPGGCLVLLIHLCDGKLIPSLTAPLPIMDNGPNESQTD